MFPLFERYKSDDRMSEQINFIEGHSDSINPETLFAKHVTTAIRGHNQ